jgi:hypothetical protein
LFYWGKNKFIGYDDINLNQIITLLIIFDRIKNKTMLTLNTIIKEMKDVTFGFPSLEDIYTLNDVNVHTISQEGNYSLPLSDRGQFKPYLKSPNLFTDNIGPLERSYYGSYGPDYFNGHCTDYGTNFYQPNTSYLWFQLR